MADALVFSSLWVSLAACALCAAASRALGVTPSTAMLGLAFAGTLFVYGVDRLRDIESDRRTTPARSSFVAAHTTPLTALAAGAGGLAAVLALRAGPAVAALAAPLAAIGLLHRRLKHLRAFKPLYVAAAWIAMAVGIPAVASGTAQRTGWTSFILFAGLYANAIASSACDGVERVPRAPVWPLRLARASALLGVAAGALAPPSQRSLGWIPLATLVALVAFRPVERYVAFALDGALLGGALIAIAWR